MADENRKKDSESLEPLTNEEIDRMISHVEEHPSIGCYSKPVFVRILNHLRTQLGG